MSALQKQDDFACSGTSLDDITVFLGTLPPAEYELRRRIRGCRNAANFMVTHTENANALTLYWMVCETATQSLYSPASLTKLGEIAQFLGRLLIIADQAQDLEAA